MRAQNRNLAQDFARLPKADAIVAPVDDAGADARAGASANAAQPTVLLVEDTEIVREIRVHRRRAAGCAVLHASSGEEALAAMRLKRFDCVFCDQQMPPGIDGVETARRLREHELCTRPRAPPQPLFLLTAIGGGDAAVRLAERSRGLVNGVLDKQTPTEELVQLVRGMRKTLGELS